MAELPAVVVCTFVVDTKTNESQLYGNVEPMVALQMFQAVVIGLMAQQRNGSTPEEAPDEADRVPQ